MPFIKDYVSKDRTMKTYLQLNTSLHGAQAQSTRLASQDEEARAAALAEAGKRIEQFAA
jgi:hypothetical protein